MEATIVKINKFHLGDCTNNGASSRHEQMIAFAGDLKEIEEHVKKERLPIDYCLYVVPRILWGEEHYYMTPLAFALNEPNGPVMFGGNTATGGGYHEMNIHDRNESWEEYRLHTMD